MSLQTKPSPHETSRGKPVLVYIMILFIAAFLLMALSFAAQRRSNEEAMGDVHATLKDLQAEQARLPELAAENAALKNQITEVQQQLEKVSAALGDTALSLEAAQSQLRAMEQLCSLQQLYMDGDYAACAKQIKTMESDGAADDLPAAQNSLFLEIKQAVAAAPAASAEPVLEEK